MKKVLSWLILALIVSPPVGASDFMKDKVIEKVKAHAVSIAVYYTMSEQEFLRRKKIRSTMPIIIQEVNRGYPEKTLAYIGAGYIASKNFVVTVDHLFGHNTHTYSRTIWVFVQGLDHPVEATLVARTNVYPNYTYTVQTNDYAVLHLKENLNLPGLKLAKNEIKPGDKAMWVGSTGGFAFFPRFGYITEFEYFFKTDSKQRLHLSYWEVFPYLTVYPGGSGDSGGVIVNKKGKVVGIMYCGISNNEEVYIFSNPLRFLKKFIKDNKLGRVIK